ncbi:MAG: DUF4350 domain-containing protein [Planctomycetota bacterium]
MTKTRPFLRRFDWFWLGLVILVVVLQFWWLPGTTQLPDDTYSSSIEGKLGFYRVVERIFPSVDRSRDQLVPDEPCLLVMISPERYPNEREQKQLKEFVNNGGVLLFAPNWSKRNFDASELGFELKAVPPRGPRSTGASTIEDPVQSDDVVEDESGPDIETDPGILATTRDLKVYSDIVDGTFKVRTRSLFDDTPYMFDELAATDEGEQYAISWFYGNGVISVCSSPDVFTNMSMMDEAHAFFAVKLIEHAFDKSQLDPRVDSVTFSEYFNVASNYRYSGILFSPVLRGGTLQLMLIGLLFAWFSFHRFGPALSSLAGKRRSLEDSARAVGNLLYRSSDGGAALRNYVEYVNSRLRREYGNMVSLDKVDLLAARSGLPAEEIRTKLIRCKQLSGAPNVSSADAAEMIRWLTQLLAGTNKAVKRN